MATTKRPGALNFTTNVEVGRTVGEMQDLLARAGASHIGVEYRDRRPVGLSFTYETEFGLKAFALPVDVDAAQRLLKHEEDRGAFRSLKKAAGTFSSPEHAARVAWRVMKDWLEAQLALIDYRMVTLEQVMLPYLIGDDGQTLYTAYRQNQQAITRGPSK